MNLLPHQLRPCLGSRVCLVGIGNPRLGDDAVGVFIEAVDFGGRPGAVTVLQTEEILTRFKRLGPQVHSLGPLAERIESNGHTKAWVLGVQPASLRPDRPLSRSVQSTFQALVQLLSHETGLAQPA